MKLALYRKYRPTRFSDVVGQEDIIAALRNQVAAGRTGHAYLFTGVRGTGKTTLARMLAKAVNCPNTKDGEPCGECEICRGIDNGSVLDVTEIDAASNNRVDDVRDLLDETSYTPAMCNMRVYIVDEVHMLTMQAFNALLKTLEEPPRHVMFILATTEVQKVPATILSRCQRFDFKRIPEDMIAERVRYVAAQEGISVTEEASSLIARLSDGALRDALSLLDTCASLDTNVDEEVVKRLAGVTDREYLFDLADRIRDRDIAGALGIVSELYNNSMDPVRLLPEMIRHYRNLLMVRVGQVTLNDCSSAMQKKYEEVSREYDETEILDCLDVLSDASDRMARSLDREITLELAVISLAGGRTGRQESGPVRKTEAKIERREIKREEKKQTTPQSTAKPKETDIPVPEVTSKEGPADSTASPESENSETKDVAEESGEKLLDRWDDCVAEIKERNRTLGALLNRSSAHITDTHLLIEANPMAIKFIRDNEESRTIIKEAVALVTGLKLPVGPWHGNSDKKETKDDDGFEEFLRKAMEAGVEVERE
ncbi:MAG: DNA polymerase III subunit gamma/tau [Oscillospiraceae bacterium]|nr:DNA polymerase III subunit gamma/tau [Oscillospiraceae bacterium]